MKIQGNLVILDHGTRIPIRAIQSYKQLADLPYRIKFQVGDTVYFGDTPSKRATNEFIKKLDAKFANLT